MNIRLTCRQYCLVTISIREAVAIMSKAEYSSKVVRNPCTPSWIPILTLICNYEIQVLGVIYIVKILFYM